MKKKISDKQFIRIAEGCLSMREASKILSIPFTTFKRRAEKLNIYNPSRGGKIPYKKTWNTDKIPLYEILTGHHPTYERHNLKRRLLKEGIFENKCSDCGITEWNGNPIVIQLDHINGVNNDHRLENLRMLCPNCHSQTGNYAGKNKKRRSNVPISDIDFIKALNDSYTIHMALKTLDLTCSGVYYDRAHILLDSGKAILKTKPSGKIKNKKIIIILVCNSCGCNISKNSKSGMCLQCQAKSVRKVKRPSLEQLLEDTERYGFSGTGRKYGVSDNAIRKWIKKYQKDNIK